MRGPGLGRRDPLHPRGDLQVLAPGELSVGGRYLERESDPSADLFGAVDDIQSIYERAATGGAKQGRKDGDGRGLPCAVRPEEPVRLAVTNLEADPGEGAHTTVVRLWRGSP